MPRLGEDVRNVTLIVGSAALGLAATAALFASSERPAPPTASWVEVRVERGEAPEITAPRIVTSGAERLYGTVETLDGERVEGFLRWDRNEGSWADLLDAVKSSGSGVATETGVRFGHIARIEATGDRSARIEMRSGEAFDLRSSSTDLGVGMRSLTVEPLAGEPMSLRWDDLAEIRFAAAPADARSTVQRLHGEVTTRSGQRFVGFVTWDIDEIYSSDVLDGDVDGRDVDVPFGAIASIERAGSRASRVTLHDGAVLRMTGSNDVAAGNNGVTVSDPELGQVRVDWSDLASVRFFPPETTPGRDDFEGSGRVRGTVIGSTGDSWTGDVTWDQDEARGWDILNGDRADAEFFVEFGRVARIEKTARGARITLRDGRTLDLRGTQDVGPRNRGIRVDGVDGSRTFDWDEFQELRIEG